MFNKLAAAVIAVSLIAGPALAQNSPTPGGTSQPAAQADTVKTTTKMSVTHVKKTHKHAAKMGKHRKHVAHVKHFKGKHMKQVKHMKRPAKSITNG